MTYYPILLHSRDDPERVPDFNHRYHSSIGLANQLFTLVIEISKAVAIGCFHIIIDSFMTDINKGTIKKIGEVIDLAKTQENMRQITGWESVQLLDRADVQFDTAFLFKGRIHPDCSWFNHPFPEKMPEYLRAIVYVPILNQIADQIQLPRGSLSVIHLRIEDDILSHVSQRSGVDIDYVRRALSKKFKQAIQENIPIGSDILVCGSEERLGLETQYRFHQFNGEKKRLLDEKYGDSGRELCAIIDYFLSRRANDVWIGACHETQNTGSSFSYYLLVSSIRRTNVYLDLYNLHLPLRIQRENKMLALHDLQVFRDEHGRTINHKDYERDEQLDVYLFVPSDAVVLELGGRYGTVSCLVNRMLKDRKKHVVVEPDSNVLPGLYSNREASGSEFHIFNGILSKSSMSLYFAGSATCCYEDPNSKIEHTSMADLETLYNLKFDTLIVDCEGCFKKFMDENDLSNIRLILLEKDQVRPIILEKDQTHLCDYNELDGRLHKMGFIMIKNVLNGIYRSVYVNTLKLGFKIRSSSLGHGSLGLFGKLGYATDQGSDIQLDEEAITISTHGPSRIVIELFKPMSIRGYASPGIEKCPKISFYADEKLIGTIDQAAEKTDSLHLVPGEYLLTVDSILGWCHSIWLLNPC